MNKAQVPAIIAVELVCLLAWGVAEPSGAAPPARDLTCDGTYRNVTVKNVKVEPGASCTLVDSTVLGNVHARDAVDVLVLDTDVAHNINVMGATGDVKIGNAVGCSFDPSTGNNIMVKKSHNVLICRQDVDNNIMVTGNDGRITVSDSAAGNNIMVNRNRAFVPDGDATHSVPGAIRVIRCTVRGHLFTKGNDPSRTVVLRANYVGD